MPLEGSFSLNPAGGTLTKVTAPSPVGAVMATKPMTIPTLSYTTSGTYSICHGDKGDYLQLISMLTVDNY